MWPFQRRQKNLPKLVLHDRRVNLVTFAERGNLRNLKTIVQRALASSEAFLLQGERTETPSDGELPIARCWAVVRATVGGHTEVVRYFVNNFSDIVPTSPLVGFQMKHVLRKKYGLQKSKELPNCCTEGKVWHRHSPPAIALHWAASTGNVEVLRILVSAGASVDWKDELSRTPLHWAAYFRRDKAVKYLLSCGAQVNAVNFHGITPLMDCLKGVPFHSQMETVHLLTGHGADITVQTAEGATVFHIIATLPPEESCRLLAMLVRCDKWRAIPLLFHPPENSRYSLLPALLYAAQEDKKEFVEYVISHFDCDPALKADAVLGLSTHCTEIENIRKLWERAFHIREESGAGVTVQPLIETYGNRREITNWEEAKRLLECPYGGVITDAGREDLHYQLAIMQERIFGLGNPHVIEFLWSLAAQLCYSGHHRSSERFYLRGLELLLVSLGSRRYAIDLCISTNQPQSEISFMIRCNHVPDFSRYVKLYLGALSLISEVSGGMDKSQFRRDQLAEFCNYLAEMAFLVLCTWAYFSHQNSASEELQQEITDLGRQLLERASFVLCYSLLDVVCKTTEWVKPSERGHYKHFIQTTLLSWAKLAHAFDAVDSNGQRPLHLLLSSMNPNNDLLKLLLENGAHVDAVNYFQKKAIGLFHDFQRPSSLPEIEPLLAPASPLSLTCLAAKAVVASKVPYQSMDSVSPRVKRLASLHDPNAPRGQFIHTTHFLPPVVSLYLLP